MYTIMTKCVERIYLENAYDLFGPPAHLAWADFEIKVKQIAHSILRFDQWNSLISKM